MNLFEFYSAYKYKLHSVRWYLYLIIPVIQGKQSKMNQNNEISNDYIFIMVSICCFGNTLQ